MSDVESLFPRMHRIRYASLAIGIVTLIPCLFGAFYQPAQFFHSYLIAYLYILSFALGATGMIMVYHLTSGYWGLITRRIMESAARTLPLLALMTIPLLFGLSQLYPWSHPGAASDELLRAKKFYMTVPFFVIRQFIYFAVWIGISHFLNRWSSEQDRTDDPRVLKNLRFVSGPGLLLLALTITFAAVDWIMSLEPHYYSTTFGFRLITYQALTGLTFATLIALLLAKHGPIAPLIDHKRLRDLGNMVLASLILWGYIAFTEYLIVWAGDIPKETSWFRHRFWAGWGRLAWLLVALRFFVPFFLLLMRAIKHRPRILAGVAAWILLTSWIELFWMVEPSEHSTFFLHWMNLPVSIGLIGFWLAAFLWQLEKRPLMPLHDPLFQEKPDEQSTVPG
jgi:hypothetical protein